MNDLQPVFQRVVAALERAEVPYAVVGSVAATSWGLVRSTRDIDIVALIAQDRVQELIAALDNDDLYLPKDELRRAATDGGSFNILHPASGGKVDVFVSPRDQEFDAMRIIRRVRTRLLDCDTWVSTAEDIILAKLLWRIESRSERQWQDCAEIASFNSLDEGHMRKWAAKIGVSEDLDDLFTQLKRHSL